MSNMSYCMFENTSKDMVQCINAMQDWIESGGTFRDFYESLSSDYERDGFDSVIRLSDIIQETLEELREA